MDEHAMDEHNEVLPNLGPGPTSVVLPQQTWAAFRPHWFITLSPTSRTLTGMDEHNEVLPLPPQDNHRKPWQQNPGVLHLAAKRSSICTST